MHASACRLGHDLFQAQNYLNHSLVIERGLMVSQIMLIIAESSYARKYRGLTEETESIHANCG